jgi:predicted phosphodiesterase
MRTICVIGDLHGHVQLALCMAARWQRETGQDFEAVFLCGDVGTFTADDQLDSTTRRHGKSNPCELEFLQQWSVDPQPSWLAGIFPPTSEGGLGLTCPVVMVHGNHEGFAHLEKLIPEEQPEMAVDIAALPAIEAGGWLRLLPPGWKCMTASGLSVAGVGGIEQGQRYADYHPMAYIDDDAVIRLLESDPVDLLVTHQGPSGVQGDKGSETLQLLLDNTVARVWCHGHSIVHPDIVQAGPEGETLVVPLHDIAFPCKGPTPDDPGEDGFCMVTFDPEVSVLRQRPDFWRRYRKNKWRHREGYGLVCPDLT